MNCQEEKQGLREDDYLNTYKKTKQKTPTKPMSCVNHTYPLSDPTLRSPRMMNTVNTRNAGNLTTI